MTSFVERVSGVLSFGKPFLVDECCLLMNKYREIYLVVNLV
jgi:hypothetical protein